MERKELLDINLDYLDKINIPDYKFGIEIEFAGAIFNGVKQKLDEILKYESNTIEELRQIEKDKEEFKKWRLVNDGSVQSNAWHRAKKGGEINSPIIRDRKKAWNELKKVCKMLRTREYIKISENCSIHIHTERDIYSDLEELKNLLKLWIVYEDIIYRFGYGETDIYRPALLNYAKPLSSNFAITTDEMLKKLEDIETKRDLLRLVSYEKNYGLNLTNVTKEPLRKDDIIKPTIEVRIYNGTLNENIIQNNVRFNMNLLNYCKKENFDNEFIEYRIKNFKRNFINDSIFENPEKADELSKLLFKDELDRLKFLKQYYKIYNQNDIEKSIHL
jgi:hypothetical protein